MIKYLVILLLVLPSLADESDLQFGKPSGNGQTIARHGFTLLYSNKHEQALWVSYELDTFEVRNAKHERTDDFRPDPEVTGQTATVEDYKGSGYDRGHLAPAADMAWSKLAMFDSFYFSNMTPQDPRFNRVGWRKLEAKCREWAEQYGAVQIITGPVILWGDTAIGPSKVTVPAGYYKVIYAHTLDKPRVIAFMMPNRELTKPLQHYVVSVDRLEVITGLDFLSELPDAQEAELEAAVDAAPWFE